MEVQRRGGEAELLMQLFGRWPRGQWARHLGRRGAVLLTFATMDALFGIAALLTPLKGNPNLLIWPTWVWAGGWFGVSVICTIGAWWKRGDSAAFAAALLIKWTYSIAYLVAFWRDDLYRGWSSFAFWFLFGGLVLLLAGWREDRETDAPLLIVTRDGGEGEEEEEEEDPSTTLTRMVRLHRGEEAGEDEAL